MNNIEILIEKYQDERILLESILKKVKMIMTKEIIRWQLLILSGIITDLKNLNLDPVTELCRTTEIVQKLPDGTEEVKYRRTYKSKEAAELMKFIDDTAHKSGYFYRHVR